LPKGLSIGGLIDRYEREVYPLKSWGRSESADLKRLKAEFGNDLAANLTHERLMEGFMQMHDGGAGGVTISARAGYLVVFISVSPRRAT
jgi:hypothetical protein